eukprot:351505-Chlamydomonas_euryale.AAC.12
MVSYWGGLAGTGKVTRVPTGFASGSGGGGKRRRLPRQPLHHAHCHPCGPLMARWRKQRRRARKRWVFPPHTLRPQSISTVLGAPQPADTANDGGRKAHPQPPPKHLYQLAA